MVDFNLVGLMFPPEHHVLEGIIDKDIVAFSKDIK